MNRQATDVFGALARDTRLCCLLLLLRCGELCVFKLTRALGVSQPHRIDSLTS
jgi:DNA-binding transcriptional ArsR family regulator